jgi:hypothetical protein
VTVAVAAFFRSLVVDPRSQRAIDETRLDWCFEAAAAKSPASRAFCHLRSTLALLRALVGSLPRELRHVPAGTLAWRLVILTLLPAAVATLWRFRWDWTLRRVPSAWWVPELLVAQLPQALLVFSMLGAFYAVAWRSEKPVPSLAVVAGAFSLFLVLLTVVLPLGSNHYSDLIWQTFNLERGTDIANPYRRGTGILWGLFDEGPRFFRAAVIAIRDLTAASLCASAALLATRVRHFRGPKYVAWLASPFLCGALLLVPELAALALIRLWPVLPAPLGAAALWIWSVRPLPLMVLVWLVIAAIISASVWLTRATAGSDSRLAPLRSTEALS